MMRLSDQQRHRTDKQRRRAFLRWDFAAHWRTDVASVLAFSAGGYCLLGISSPPGAGGFAVLGCACAFWPRSGGLRANLFGSGLEARKGSRLDTPEIATPEISEPQLATQNAGAGDEQAPDHPRSPSPDLPPGE